MKRFITGIAGPSGSGKTTVVRELMEILGRNEVAQLSHDSYYYDLASLPLEERALHNFDHPEALETSLLLEHLRMLGKGEAAEIPEYDFARHVRQGRRRLEPRKYLILEGVLILCHEPLRELCDLTVFLDAPLDLCLSRRIRRDLAERERSVEAILDQYEETVRPMLHEFVLPSREHADVVLQVDQRDASSLALEIKKHLDRRER